VQPVFACPDIDEIVKTAKTFVGSTKYREDSLKLCLDIYQNAKVPLRYDVTESNIVERLANLSIREVKSLETQAGSMMLWQEDESSTPYFALYLGKNKVLTSWHHKDGFTPYKKVTITSYKKASGWSYFKGFIPIFTIYADE
jgi:hypothetical protein